MRDIQRMYRFHDDMYKIAALVLGFPEDCFDDKVCGDLLQLTTI